MKRKKRKPGEDIMFLLLFPVVLFCLYYVSYFYGTINFEAGLIMFALLLGVAVALHTHLM